MFMELFTALYSMLSESPAAALTGSFLWGIAGILLSPCHLASIPLIVGYIDSQGRVNTGRAALVSTLFSSGILISIAAIGIITGIAGRLAGDIGPYGNLAVALLVTAVGLHMLGILPIPFLQNGISQPAVRRKGLAAAFLLGLFFGIALGPCTFAYMAPVIGVAFTVASSGIFFPMALITAYAAGHCLVIILAGTSAGLVARLLNWNETSRGASLLKKFCGLLVFAAGLYMIASAIKLYYPAGV